MEDKNSDNLKQLSILNKTKVSFISLCLASFLVGCVSTGIYLSTQNNISNSQSINISSEYKSSIVSALNNRLHTEDLLIYETTLNGYVNALTIIDSNDNVFVKSPYNTSTSETSEDIELAYLDSAYIDAENNYYKANTTNSDDGTVSTTWIDYPDNFSNITKNIRNAYTSDILSSATNIEYIGKSTMSEDVGELDIYRVYVSSDVFKTLFAGESIEIYKSIILSAEKNEDAAFKDYTNHILDDINMVSVFSDGYVDMGIKDDNLYYLSFVTGGGGNLTTSQILFMNKLPANISEENLVIPKTDSLTTLYEDALNAYTNSMQGEYSEDE